jgi:Cu+-exporting ATPase
MYCKNASVIETMDKIDTLVFDKTGTLTNHQDTHLVYIGAILTQSEMNAIRSVTRESLHPLSQLVTKLYHGIPGDIFPVTSIENIIGKGTKAICNGVDILIGSSALLQANGIEVGAIQGTSVYIAMNGAYKGQFKVNHTYRPKVDKMLTQLKKAGYQIHLLSGDHATEKQNLVQLLGSDVPLFFEQSPQNKLEYIQQLQKQGRCVMMIGDGLNDAGALQKANVGIAVTDQTHLFTPASDGILEGSMIPNLANLLRFAKKGKLVILLIFILSIIYNLVGMYFATRAQLSPMVAAILMPISSISIVSLSALLTYLFSRQLAAKN